MLRQILGGASREDRRAESTRGSAIADLAGEGVSPEPEEDLVDLLEYFQADGTHDRKCTSKVRRQFGR